MATSPPLLSIEVYLQTSYKPDVHFIDGEIEERNVGEHTHSFIQTFITALFALHEEEWRAEAVVEQRIRINSSQVRVCDVAILQSDAPWEEVISIPPIACIEIKSQEDRLSRAEKVLADYFAMGVPNIWLIDPHKRKVYSYAGGSMHEIDATELIFRNSPIRISLTALFAKLDKKLAANRL